MRFRWTSLTVAIFSGMAVLVFIFASVPSVTVCGGWEVRCQNHLKQIAGLLMCVRAEGTIRFVPGADFPDQVEMKIKREDLGVLRCPAAPDEADRTYRGPDAHLLDVMRYHSADISLGPGDVIIACDANGPNGDEPYHEDGVCVLYASSRVRLIKWEEMEGYDGGPVKVGPGSPDPRFRHLVR